MTQTPSAQVNVLDELQRLCAQIQALEGTLRAQHGVLRQRNIQMPTATLERIYYLHQDLESLRQRAAQTYRELEQFRALAEITHLINSSLEQDVVLTEVVDMAIALTGAERGYIMLRDEDDDMRFYVARDAKRRTLDESKFTVSSTIVTQAAETRQPVVTQDALMDMRFDAQKSIVLHAPRSVICVPLIYKENVIGVLYADNRRVPNLFGERETALLVAFANQAAIAIQNARMYARVRQALVEITEMKELMDNVLASIASGVITTDTENRVQLYNRAAEHILGVPREKALGQTLMDVLPGVFEGFEAVLERVWRENRQQVVEVEPVLPERGAVNLSLKFTPLQDPAGETYGMAVVVDDLTEIKKRDATLNVVRTYLPPSLLRNIQSIDSLGLGGDEREISVIFADVRGFTTFSEQLDPQELMTVISRYLMVCSDAIQLYDGIVDKYMGDAIVGLFNTQLNPQTDHAVRAVRTALSMAYDVQALHEVLPPAQRLFYGIGVDTGVAMLGNVGSPSRREFTAIGAPVNFAKSLQENALAGEIIISERTYRLVQDIFSAEPIAPRKLKGHADFHVMYRVTGLRRKQ